GAALGRRQAAHIGNERGHVLVGPAVVVLAGHDHERLAAGLDAVPDGAHPIFRLVSRGHARWADIRSRQPHAFAVVDEFAAAAVAAMALRAAARFEQVLAALDGLRLAGIGHRFYLHG